MVVRPPKWGPLEMVPRGSLLAPNRPQLPVAPIGLGESAPIGGPLTTILWVDGILHHFLKPKELFGMFLGLMIPGLSSTHSRDCFCLNHLFTGALFQWC